MAAGDVTAPHPKVGISQPPIFLAESDCFMASDEYLLSTAPQRANHKI